MPDMDVKIRKPLLDVLQRKKPERVPFWLMRQAGRYLPEYRDMRSYAGSFLDMVYDSEKAAEVTMQPLRRFGMDGAILFSDILVIPHALGQPVSFLPGEGPKLEALVSESDLAKLNPDAVDRHCQPVYETISLVREKLVQEGREQTTMIGFAGSPWTVICYMAEGGGSRDFEAARRWALQDPASFQKLVDIVTKATITYLSGQIRAGAEAIQLFESWAGLLGPDQFRRWIIEPNKTIVAALKRDFPHIPVIGFPKGAGLLMLDYAKNTGIDAIGVDHTVDPLWAAQNLQPLMPVQGNLDPVRLLVGGAALDEGLETIRSTMGQYPFIFNLGHGIIKETAIENVQRLTDTVRGWTV